MEKYSLKDYIEIDSEKLEIFLIAISHFKDAVCTILIPTESGSNNKLYILPDIDDGSYDGFRKLSYLLTPKGAIKWCTPRRFK